MRVVVTGGTGHIGTYLTPMLADAGFEVICVTRGASRPYRSDPAWSRVRMVQMDRSKEPAFARRIAELEPDVVVDLICFTEDEARAMAEALRSTRCRHYLFCTSCWTHGRAEVLPFRPDDLKKAPLDQYGRQKLAAQEYLLELHRQEGFPVTVLMPGQISGPGWQIIGPWANEMLEPFRRIAAGEEILLPNFGMETLHHVHGYDVARCFFLAITHRWEAVGEVFDAVSGGSITLYGYAKLLYDYFGREPRIGFLPWKEWCDYVGDPVQCEDSYYHIARSGFYTVEKETRLLEYRPKFSNVETILQAVRSYQERGLL